MRKLILITCVAVAILLLVTACAPKQEMPKTEKLAAPTKVTVKEPSAPAAEAPLVEEEEAQPAAEPERKAEVAAPPETKKSSSVPVSQEELDRLKQGIQGIETEDLGGLSQ
jgi:cell envelope opacity-associated protein A